MHLLRRTFHSSFASKFFMWHHMTPYCDITWHHAVILWYIISSHHRPCHSDGTTHLIIVLNCYVMQFSLVASAFDLQPWPKIPLKLRSSLMPILKIKVIGQMVRPWECSQMDAQMERQKDESDSITSTTDAGGNKNNFDGMYTKKFITCWLELIPQHTARQDNAALIMARTPSATPSKIITLLVALFTTSFYNVRPMECLYA